MKTMKLKSQLLDVLHGVLSLILILIFISIMQFWFLVEWFYLYLKKTICDKATPIF